MATATTDLPAMPLVTAVMIFLNGEKYIAEAIDSILAQSYPNWELVLVDDGSTDGATAIAQDYSRRHPDRIRYIEHPHHENRGMSASRNAGVEAGRGDYVSFLDADDIWLPERLERFTEVAADFPEAGMIYGPTLYWYSWAAAAGVPSPVEGQEDFEGHTDLDPEELLEAPLVLRQFLVSNGGSLPGICSLLIRRDAYDAIGGFEPSFRGLYEDQVFLSKMTATHPVVVIDDVLDYYRQHSESCCWRSVASGDYHPDDYHPARRVYLEWLSGYLPGVGVEDPVIRREVLRQLRPYRIPFFIPLRRLARKIRRRVRPTIRRWTPTWVLKLLYRLRVRIEELIERRKQAAIKRDAASNS